MKLNLTVWQRVRVTTLVGGLRGSLAVMRKGGKILDVVELSKQEQQEVGLVAVGQSIHWEDTDCRFALEIKDREAAGLLKQVVEDHVQEKNKTESWTYQETKSLVDLCQQLKIDPEVGIEEATAETDDDKTPAAEEDEGDSKDKE